MLDEVDVCYVRCIGIASHVRKCLGLDSSPLKCAKLPFPPRGLDPGCVRMQNLEQLVDNDAGGLHG